MLDRPEQQQHGVCRLASRLGELRAQLTLPAIEATPLAPLKAWVDYGMTQPHIAKAYGVAVSALERLI